MALLTQHKFPSNTPVEYNLHYSTASTFPFAPDVLTSRTTTLTESSIADADSTVAATLPSPPQPSLTGSQPDAALHSIQQEQRTPQGNLEHGLLYHGSAVRVQQTAMASDNEQTLPLASKPRNKLGYQRTSVACGHCRRRKIRCVVAPTEKSGRCQTCIKLRKECHFYPVDQASPSDGHVQSPYVGDGSLLGSSASSPHGMDSRGSSEPIHEGHGVVAAGIGRQMGQNYTNEAGFSQPYGNVMWNPSFYQSFMNDQNVPGQWNPSLPPAPTQLPSQPPISRAQQQMLLQQGSTFDVNSATRSFSVGNTDAYAYANPYASMAEYGTRPGSVPIAGGGARPRVIPAAATPTVPSQYPGGGSMTVSSTDSGSGGGSLHPFSSASSIGSPVASAAERAVLGAPAPAGQAQWPMYVGDEAQGPRAVPVSAEMMGQFGGQWYGAPQTM